MKRKHEAIDVIDFTDIDDEGHDIVNTTGRSRATGRKSKINANVNTDWVESPLSDHESTSSEDRRDIADGRLEGRPWTLILSIFPGICPDYIETLYREQAKELSGPPTEKSLVNAILQLDGYPMKEDTKRRKLEQDKVEKSVRWGVDDNVKRDRRYFSSSKTLIALDFAHIPSQYIKNILKEKGCLYAAYLALDSVDATYSTANPKPYKRQNQGVYHLDMGSDSVNLARGYSADQRNELRDARSQCKKKRESRRAQKQKLEAEAKNAAMHAANGGLVECQCCFTDTPLNRLTGCTGESVHFFCGTCMKSNAETQIGIMKYDVKCMDMSGCSAPFSRKTLVDVLGETIINKLDEFQQRDEIELAGIEGLEDCPFCDFKAICPPVEEDREFRCYKPDCKKVSCRLCREVSHIPKTCEEVKKEKNIPVRHTIEEAMSEAIIRICPNLRCKTPIIKDEGCNKMSCTKCGRKMCYVCKKDITKDGYNHFTDNMSGCTLHDQGRGNWRQVDEATKAKEAAIQKALRDNPGLREDDLSVDGPKQERADYPAIVPMEFNGQWVQHGYAPAGNQGNPNAIDMNMPVFNYIDQHVAGAPIPPPNAPGYEYPHRHMEQLQQMHDMRVEQARQQVQIQRQRQREIQAEAHAQAQARAQARAQAHVQPPRRPDDPLNWMLQWNDQPPVYGANTYQPQPHHAAYRNHPTLDPARENQLFHYTPGAQPDPNPHVAPHNRQFAHYQAIYQTDVDPVFHNRRIPGRDENGRRLTPHVIPDTFGPITQHRTQVQPHGSVIAPPVNQRGMHGF